MITDRLNSAIEHIETARSYLTLALHDAGALEGMLLMPLMEQSAKMLQDIYALQSAVKSDTQEGK